MENYEYIFDCLLFCLFFCFGSLFYQYISIIVYTDITAVCHQTNNNNLSGAIDNILQTEYTENVIHCPQTIHITQLYGFIICFLIVVLSFLLILNLSSY